MHVIASQRLLEYEYFIPDNQMKHTYYPPCLVIHTNGIKGSRTSINFLYEKNHEEKRSKLFF
jgi:predicted peptidase